MEFDISRENDKEYLIEYYQSRIKRWNGNPDGVEIVDRYKKAIKKLNNGKEV